MKRYFMLSKGNSILDSGRAKSDLDEVAEVFF
jgi:hypothetical protein